MIWKDAVLANLRYALAISQGAIVGVQNPREVILATLSAAKAQSESISQSDRIQAICSIAAGREPGMGIENLQRLLKSEIQATVDDY